MPAIRAVTQMSDELSAYLGLKEIYGIIHDSSTLLFYSEDIGSL